MANKIGLSERFILMRENERERLCDLNDINIADEIGNALTRDELQIVWMLRHMPMNMTKIYLERVKEDFASVSSFLAYYHYLNAKD
ncbi:MAG: hypothetical protein K2G31_01160 [Clostridia bacterium]|nr:hypothetical protein [Clostridia bacterium]